MGNILRGCFGQSKTTSASPLPGNDSGAIDPPQSHPNEAPVSSSGPSIKSIQNTTSASPPLDNDSGSTDPPQSHPTDAPESSSGASIESIKNTIEKEHTTENIDKFIKMLDDLLLKIKGKGEEASHALENLASTADSASQFVDHFTTEAKTIEESKPISEELGRVATNVLDAIGGVHFMFLGLSLVAHTLRRYLNMKSNDANCKELLEKLTELAKEVKEFKDAMPEKDEKVRKALREIVVGVVTCCDYIEKGGASRLAP